MAFPPLFQAIQLGHPEVLVLWLLVSGGVASGLAAVIKPYAGFALLAERRWAAITLGLLVVAVTAAFLPWPRFVEDFPRISATLAEPVVKALQASHPRWLPGYQIKVLDGNHLSSTEHRLKALRGTWAAPLPGHALVVLDNCEHLVEASAEFTEALLKACPRVAVIATSFVGISTLTATLILEQIARSSSNELFSALCKVSPSAPTNSRHERTL